MIRLNVLGRPSLNALSFCKKNEQSIRNYILSSCMRNKNMYQFWKEIRKRKGCSRKTPLEMYAVMNVADVASLRTNLVPSLVVLLLLCLLLSIVIVMSVSCLLCLAQMLHMALPKQRLE